MTKHPWILAVLLLGATPLACFVSLGGENGPSGPWGSGDFGGSSGSGMGGSKGTGGGSVKGDQCNPVTAAGCPSDGSTCDLDPTGYFTCFPPPNNVDVCGVCDDNTMFCGADLTCVIPNGSNAGTCYRYCCTDADCGAGGTCDTSFGAEVLNPSNKGDAVGLCVASTANDTPACGPPAVSPSGGSCVAGYAGSPDGGGSDAGPDDGGGSGGGAGFDAGPGDGGNPFADGGHGGHHHDAGG
jgi:hypothetical protein